ncbi:Haloacid dehalogenase-like hydrolase motif-containing [Cedratvirus A11]|uniref:Haloacid dehalogenase-like hydrolase motif-containing n=1 Tax=Cedratvirus A11 TaxID=1903266 RepID=A0A1M7XU46_9VIRU|nr:Haloacid dehalogenase-like hydrolase motif-containing [Cedratvirus A11]SHO33211.1 Haloacid dehalogenase-like hydrolase motif-containing [Cedratvirus A11]
MQSEDMSKDDHGMSKDDHGMFVNDKPIFIFDLDDTLVFYNKKGAKVPRETWHTLRFLYEQGVDMYVISYNPGAYFIAAQLGLTRYIKDFITARPPRDLLLNMLLQKYQDIQGRPLVYFDDALDNLQEIRQSLLENVTQRRITLHHVSKNITYALVKNYL